MAQFKLIRRQHGGWWGKGIRCIRDGDDLDQLNQECSDLENDADPAMESFHVVDQKMVDQNSGEVVTDPSDY